MHKHKYYRYRIEYFNKFLQNGGVIYYDADGNTYTGAGVILVEKYNDKLVVILFRNKWKNNMYEDLGGNIEREYTKHKYPLAKTAKEEAFEESGCLISFADVQHINKYGVFIKQKEYRCYFIGLNCGIFYRHDYLNNIEKINMLNNIPQKFKETDDLQRFYVTDLIKNGIMNKSGKMLCADVNKKERLLSSRAVECIKAGLKKNILDYIIEHPIPFIKTNMHKFGLHLNTLISI